MGQDAPSVNTCNIRSQSPIRQVLKTLELVQSLGPRVAGRIVALWVDALTVAVRDAHEASQVLSLTDLPGSPSQVVTAFTIRKKGSSALVALLTVHGTQSIGVQGFLLRDRPIDVGGFKGCASWLKIIHGQNDCSR